MLGAVAGQGAGRSLVPSIHTVRESEVGARERRRVTRNVAFHHKGGDLLAVAVCEATWATGRGGYCGRVVSTARTAQRPVDAAVLSVSICAS